MMMITYFYYHHQYTTFFNKVVKRAKKSLTESKVQSTQKWYNRAVAILFILQFHCDEGLCGPVIGLLGKKCNAFSAAFAEG